MFRSFAISKSDNSNSAFIDVFTLEVELVDQVFRHRRNKILQDSNSRPHAVGDINTENDVNVISNSLIWLTHVGHIVGCFLLNAVGQNFKYLVKLKLPQTFSCQRR